MRRAKKLFLASVAAVVRAQWSAAAGVSTLCDSWSAQQYVDAPHTVQSLQSPLTWWAGLSGQTPQWVNNTGVSGERIDQWYPRLPAILADQSKWVLLTTPQNSFGQAFGGYTAVAGPNAGQSITLANVLAAVQAEVAGLMQGVIRAGKTPIVYSCVGVSTWNATQIAIRNAYNVWLQWYCAVTNSVFVDARAILTDGNLSTANYLSGYEMPGAAAGHPSNIGSYYLGKAIWKHPALSIMATRDILPISTAAGQPFGNQVLANCLFLTTTGGGSPGGFGGDDPAFFQWFPNGTAATVLASHAAETYGNGLIHADTYTGAVAQEMRHSQTISTGLSGYAGKTIQAVAQIDVSAGNTNFLGVDLRSTNTVGGVTASAIDGYSQVTNAGPMPNEAFTFTFLTPAVVIPAGTVQAVGWSLRSRSTGTGSGSALFRARRVGLFVN
jgi:hypothetical protein